MAIKFLVFNTFLPYLGLMKILQQCNYLIIDVDTGVDDAMAIMVALANPDVEILGITCCHGNTPLENVLKNTLRVLKVCNRLDIPVYRGCSKPLLARKQHAGDYHGKDGLGDVPDPDAPGLDLLQKKKAVQAMIKLVNDNAGEVSALLNMLLMYFSRMDLLISFQLLLSFMYLKHNSMTTLFHYMCLEFRIFWKWFIYFKKKAQSADYKKEITAGTGFNSCDVYALAAAIDDTLITESEEVAVAVELEGTYTRGMMVVDYIQKLKKDHKAIIMKKVDLEKLKQMLTNALK
uniref:Uridine nucleosidase 1-like n=1 Tax=Neolamprologus brichardi TaxID=32507 RepID=A0A3Q4I924_NEOBR